MSFEVVTVRPFDRELKRLVKRFPSLKKEIVALGAALAVHPHMGTALGNSCYKIRLAIASKGKGKSGGGRVITHVHIAGKRVFLLSIFDKSEKDTLTDKELKELLALT